MQNVEPLAQGLVMQSQRRGWTTRFGGLEREHHALIAAGDVDRMHQPRAALNAALHRSLRFQGRQGGLLGKALDHLRLRGRGIVVSVRRNPLLQPGAQMRHQAVEQALRQPQHQRIAASVLAGEADTILCVDKFCGDTLEFSHDVTAD